MTSNRNRSFWELDSCILGEYGTRFHPCFTPGLITQTVSYQSRVRLKTEATRSNMQTVDKLDRSELLPFLCSACHCLNSLIPSALDISKDCEASASAAVVVVVVVVVALAIAVARRCTH